MLEIIVLVKQVPNTTKVKIDPETNNLVREGIPSIVNPFDLYAIEEALLLKEKFSARITALTMGPPQAVEVLKYAIALGADQGVLLSDRAFAGADTLATSYTLSAGIKKIGLPDIILCGKMAVDGDTAQVPAELAEHLDVGYIANVCRILKIESGKLTALNMMDFSQLKINVQLPAVLSVNKGINEPRLPTLKNMVKASFAACRTLTANDIGADKNRISVAGSPTWVKKVFAPESSGKGRILSGSINNQVAEVLSALKEHEVL